ncbi:MAG: septum formation initiator family protein [Chloroflexota bacterium]
MARVHAPSWIGPGLLFLFVVPLLVYGAYSIGDRWYQNYILTQQEEAIRAEVMGLRDENLRLQRELELARSDSAIEKTAREQLGLIRPGDTAIQLVGPQGPAAAAAAPAPPSARQAATTPAPPTPKPERPGWLKFLDGLFGR